MNAPAGPCPAMSVLQIAQDVAGVATRILDEVLLVVILRRIELARCGYLGRDRPREFSGFIPACFDTLRGLFLGFAGVENGRAILGPHVVMLPVESGGIVHSEEVIKQVRVTQPGGIELHLNRLGMSGAARADLFVSWVRRRAARIPNRRFDDSGNFVN